MKAGSWHQGIRVCVAGKNQIGVDVLRMVVARVGPSGVVAVLNQGDQGRGGWQPSGRQVMALLDVGADRGEGEGER